MYNNRGINDRRKFQRLSVNLSVWYKVDSPSYLRGIFGEDYTEATTLDISGRGMAFISRKTIPAWTTLHIKFVLLKVDNDGSITFTEPMQVSAEVRSSSMMDVNEYRIGVAFRAIRTEDQSEIQSFMGAAMR